MIDPANGASTCALLNQMWKGTNGVLIARLRKIAPKSRFCDDSENAVSPDARLVLMMYISVLPTLYQITMKAKSMNSDPNSVYKNSR